MKSGLDAMPLFLIDDLLRLFYVGFLEELKAKIIAFEIFRPVAPIDPAMRSMMTSLTALLFLLA